MKKKNGFKLAKERSRRYPAQTITDADNAKSITLLANSTAQAEYLLYWLERAAGGIGMSTKTKQNTYTLSKRRHLHSEWWPFETCRQVHLPRKQCLINRE